VAIGTGTPPGTLGGYAMTPFGLDSRFDGSYANVTYVDSPLGGTVGFDQGLSHRRIGQGWLTWSHGYQDDVYFAYGLQQIVLTLPENTGAFYFYAEPDSWAAGGYIITATSAGQTITQTVQGYQGAAGYGFYATEGDILTSITVVCNGDDFAIGEFGIAQVVPEPTGLVVWALLGVVALSMVLRRRRCRVG